MRRLRRIVTRRDVHAWALGFLAMLRPADPAGSRVTPAPAERKARRFGGVV